MKARQGRAIKKNEYAEVDRFLCRQRIEREEFCLQHGFGVQHLDKYANGAREVARAQTERNFFQGSQLLTEIAERENVG